MSGFTYGSKSFSLNWEEIKKVGSGFLKIGVVTAMALAALNYVTSVVIPDVNSSDNYLLISIMPFVATLVDIARKFVVDNSRTVIAK